MACFSDEKIVRYIVGEVSQIENRLIRDHLLTCSSCQQAHALYLGIEKKLENPVLKEPPETILRNVMKQIASRVSFYTSIISLIAASLILLVTWIYVYFDFSHNSFIQAIQTTTEKTGGWLHDLLVTISTLFSMVHAGFKTINTLLEAVFKVRIGIEIVGTALLGISLILFYSVFRLFKKKLRENR